MCKRSSTAYHVEALHYLATSVVIICVLIRLEILDVPDLRLGMHFRST